MRTLNITYPLLEIVVTYCGLLLLSEAEGDILSWKINKIYSCSLDRHHYNLATITNEQNKPEMYPKAMNK